MNTLIIPCAGKSSRFPNMRPKWMLTHPDGSLMIEKAIQGFDLKKYDRIVITIVKEHDEKFEADLSLKQVFTDKKIEICMLPEFTKSQSETVYQTIKRMKISGSFVVKDSDNYVVFDNIKMKNFVVGVNLQERHDVKNIPGKSFILVNEQHIITNIIEKQVKSDYISVGVYGFESVDLFEQAFLEISQNTTSELFLSHVISFLISSKRQVFEYNQASDYNDWGTINEWREETNKFTTFFLDIDGVLMKNSGKFGTFNWETNNSLLVENIKTMKELQDLGAQIIFVSSRPEKYVVKAIELISKYGLKPYAYLHSLNHAKRILVNDFSNTNPYPSAEVINIPRNGELSDYLG
ncbi:MAG: hypothetical protein FP831_06125 [Anaerolineae bacterium]|nr:hypothetical protein [Anaerolineae bacterium]